jgi:hypothetical protein
LKYKSSTAGGVLKSLAITGIFVLLLQSPGLAFRSATVQPDTQQVSFDSQFISSDTNTSANSFTAGMGLSEETGIVLERTRIQDDFGSITLGSFLIKREISSEKAGNIGVAAFGGMRFLTGRSTALGDIETNGPQVGITAGYVLSSQFSTQASASISFLDSTLSEVEYSLSYKPNRSWKISAGYRGYFINGELLDGPVVGIAAGF